VQLDGGPSVALLIPTLRSISYIAQSHTSLNHRGPSPASLRSTAILPTLKLRQAKQDVLPTWVQLDDKRNYLGAMMKLSFTGHY